MRDFLAIPAGKCGISTDFNLCAATVSILRPVEDVATGGIGFSAPELEDTATCLDANPVDRIYGVRGPVALYFCVAVAA
jgi:hypothetical protein